MRKLKSDETNVVQESAQASDDEVLLVKHADAMRRADRNYSDDKTRALVWESANAPHETPLPSALAVIVETTWIATDALVATVQRLRDDLALFDKRGEHGHLMKANDLAERNRHDAFRAYLTAKLSFEEWERDNEIVFASLRAEANRALQREKELGFRSKAITEADCVAKMAELFPDEWRAQEMRRRSAKFGVDAIEDLFHCWESRCRTLNNMLAKAR